MPTREQTVIYLAGHFDGEGTVYNAGKSPKYPKYKCTVVCVSHTHYQTLQLYQSIFSGSITSVSERCTKHRLGKKPIWQWRLASMLDVSKFLLEVIPWLVEKKSRSEIALALVAEKLIRRYDRQQSQNTGAGMQLWAPKEFRLKNPVVSRKPYEV